ncbi:unnamed protein product [Bursaphelenchus okinawaensis]|uniref:Uncharacterized protein n=1 Tax=Bursaphelenchus okinawaensis TaxID=465554 RepID=A0A811KYK9_9BILA|nr:unnamed protein product [Bursaphelenchus okinawaensis]CAG9113964.1 unnamed protein product [Bursaphelenchus okinawaensis]
MAVNSYIWQMIVLALVCLACTFTSAQPVGVLGLEAFNDNPFEQVQMRERKSNNLRNLMRIGRRSEAPVVPGFEMRQSPLDYAQFFRPNAAIF